jgi:hypothetical protein
MDKKMLKIMGIVLGGFVILIIILVLIAACSKKKLDYNKLQDTMVSAAKSYFQTKPDDLPKEDGDTRSVALKKLISDGFMEEPSKTYKNEELVCDGSITVSNNNGYYLYSPSLTCGKDFKTQLLKDKIIDDSLVDSGNGLYEVGDEYIYKGEVDNNYVRFPGQNKLFRIIRVNDDGTIRLIETEGLENIQWDNRYNTMRTAATGNNDYVFNNLNSRIKDAVKGYYNDSSIWPDQVKAYIITQELCIGKRSDADITKDGSTECAVKIDNQQLGLLNVYEFMQASLDNNCTSTRAIPCSNYNWFNSFKKRIWTVTADAGDTSKVYVLFKSISSSMCNNSYSANAVFNISDKVTYVSGDGTAGNPYVFR